MINDIVQYMMQRNDGGNCTALVVGGAPESLYSRPGKEIKEVVQTYFEIEIETGNQDFLRSKQPKKAISQAKIWLHQISLTDRMLSSASFLIWRASFI